MNIKENLTAVGVIVGRFQTDALHQSHRNLIDFVSSRHSRVVIFLAVAVFSGDDHDPLDYDSRRLMIQESYPSIIVLPILNNRSDEVWSANLDASLRPILLPGETPTLYGGRDSFIPYYSGKYTTVEVEDPSTVLSLSATAIRERLGHTIGTNQGFRAGIIHHAMSGYPVVNSTVDVAIYDPTAQRVLLGRKPGEKELRFIGGWTDVNSSSNEEDAAREVSEETGLTIGVDDLCYIGSFNIADWRIRASKKRIIRTNFFIGLYTFGAPQPADDIAEVQWVTIQEASSRVLVVEEHRELMSAFLKAIQDKDTLNYKKWALYQQTEK